MRPWDYADMSSMAKEAGGPKELLTSYYNNGYSAGVNAQRSTDLFAGAIALAAGFFGRMAVEHLFTNRDNMTVTPKEDVELIENAISDETMKGQINSDYQKIVDEIKRNDPIKEVNDMFIKDMQAKPGYEDFASDYRVKKPDADELEVSHAFMCSIYKINRWEVENE